MTFNTNTSLFNSLHAAISNANFSNGFGISNNTGYGSQSGCGCGTQSPDQSLQSLFSALRQILDSLPQNGGSCNSPTGNNTDNRNGNLNSGSQQGNSFGNAGTMGNYGAYGYGNSFGHSHSTGYGGSQHAITHHHSSNRSTVTHNGYGGSQQYSHGNSQASRPAVYNYSYSFSFSSGGASQSGNFNLNFNGSYRSW